MSNLTSTWFKVAVASVVAAAIMLRLWRASKQKLFAAIDIGSGEHKLVVARLIAKDKVQVVHSESVGVALALDLQKRPASNELSSEILADSFSALQKFCEDARELGVTGSPAGVATAVFRRASNGEAYITRVASELRLRLSVVDQVLEARLGYLTAKAAVSRGNQIIQQNQLLSWDSGGGSFQISDANGNVYLGPIGNGDVYAMLQDISALADDISSTTITTLIQDIQKLLPPRPDWLADALKKESTRIVGFGHTTSIFRLAADCVGKVDLDRSVVQYALYNILLGKTESEQATLLRAKSQEYASIVSPYDYRPDTPYPETNLLLPKLALLFAVMTHLEIPSVHYEYANGSCLGILLHEDFWKKQHNDGL
mmetsp:Transcript_5793/g.8562  ORF Transcript_5793/g.8562 Transcript_5793/m.8562 type:complete len:370 (+) Transcript_5793:31-1140(+)